MRRAVYRHGISIGQDYHWACIQIPEITHLFFYNTQEVEQYSCVLDYPCSRFQPQTASFLHPRCGTLSSQLFVHCKAEFLCTLLQNLLFQEVHPRETPWSHYTEFYRRSGVDHILLPIPLLLQHISFSCRQKLLQEQPKL